MMKERIITCSMELFGKYGIKGLTMDAIASELGISKRTLYEHFSCKEQLLNECLGARLEEHRLLAPTGEGLIDELLALYTAMQRIDPKRAFRFCMELKKFYSSVYQELMKRLIDYATVCSDKVDQGIADGYLRRDTTSCMVRTVVAGYLTQLFAYTDCEYTDARRILSAETIVIFARGLCTIKGRAYLDQKLKASAQ